MSCSTYLLLLSCLLIVSRITIAQRQQQLLYKDCLDPQQFGSYTPKSAYEENLNGLLLKIYYDAKIDYGFYNYSSNSKDSDKAYVIALCRRDISVAQCRACVNSAASAVKGACPTNKEVIGGYDNCMLRYSNRYVFNHAEAGPYFWVYNPNNVSDVHAFSEALISILNTLRDKAASSSDSRYKYATEDIKVNNELSIYAMVQCTPDLLKQDCTDCLSKAIALIPQCCVGKQGGRVIMPSCHFRYEIGLFYNPNA